jgi:hypothetical protein
MQRDDATCSSLSLRPANLELCLRKIHLRPACASKFGVT